MHVALGQDPPASEAQALGSANAGGSPRKSPPASTGGKTPAAKQPHGSIPPQIASPPRRNTPAAKEAETEKNPVEAGSPGNEPATGAGEESAAGEGTLALEHDLHPSRPF